MSFRLAGLLRLRRLEQDQRGADLTRANRRRHEASERTSRVRGDLDTSGAEPADRASMLALAAVRSSTRALLTELTAAEAATAAEAEDARTAHAAAKARTASIEKLEERYAAAVAAEELRAEQLALDEAAARGSRIRTETEERR